jgi:hypothetical protein
MSTNKCFGMPRELTSTSYYLKDWPELATPSSKHDTMRFSAYNDLYSGRLPVLLGVATVQYLLCDYMILTLDSAWDGKTTCKNRRKITACITKVYFCN